MRDPRRPIERVKWAERREGTETSEERRAHAAAQLDRVILRMNAILTSRDAKDSTVIRAAEQLISAIARKARLLGDEAPARQIIRLNYVSEEALAEEREQLEATLTAMGVDLSVLPTPEEIAQLLLASRPPLALPERVDVGPAGGIALRARNHHAERTDDRLVEVGLLPRGH